MASFPLRSKSIYHARSVSLPSWSHPLIPQVNEDLSSVGNKLSSLKDMYNCLDDLLLLPHTQKVFAQLCHAKWVEEALDGYLRLLDVCAAAKDVSSQTKQDVQGLLSVLRRRRETNYFSGYLASRMKAKKAIQKSLKDLKSIKSKNTGLASDKDCKTLEIVVLLNEVEAATVGVFESLLSYVAGTKMQSRLGGFSLVSKLMHRKGVDEETNANEFEKFDGALQTLTSHRTSKTDSIIHIENLQNQLGEMELSIQELEKGLDSLFRRLIKTRVSLLNILNH